MTLSTLIKRNTKMFFKDKAMFFTAMITPLILLVLYMTFLGNVYKESFTGALPGIPLNDELDKLINAVVAGQLVSSLLAVCCVTVAFCSNMLMVQDKATGARNDLNISPVKRSTLAVGYYVSTLISTLIIAIIATGAGFGYIASVGWYLSTSDVLFVLLDVFLLTMFGTALSSVVNFFLSSQGQIAAVGSIVSSVYGFLCGAYMPISQFGDGLQKVLMFLPGTHATSLLRGHTMRGAFEEMRVKGFPDEVVDSMMDTVDYNIYFFGDKIPEWTKFTVLGGCVVLLIAAYVILNMAFRQRKK